MAKKLKFFRGPKESMPQLEVGEPGFTTDEKRLYVGDGTENVGIAKQEDIADIVTTTGGGSVTMPGGYEGPVEIIFTEETDEGGTLYVAISGTDGSYTSDSGAKAIYEAFTGGSAVFATIGENIVPLTHVSLSGSTYSAQFNVLSGIEGYQSILLTQSDTTQHVYVLENKPTAEDVTYDNGTSGLAATDVQGAIDEVVSEKQDKITGTQGQIVGFNEAGEPVAQAAPATGVTSFKERTGAVTPQAGDYTAEMVGARPSTWTPTADDVGARPNTWTPSAEDVGAIPSSQKGQASGVAELDSTGHVPAAQLPSYVDDVIEAYVVGSTPLAQDWLSAESGGTALTPEVNKIYLVVSAGDYENKQYRWAGTQYAVISDSIALGETASTAYYGDKGKAAYDHSQLTSGNPHNVTAEDIGLEDAVTIADGGTMTPPEGLTGPYTLIFTEETSDVVSGALVVHVTMSSETSGTPDSTYEEIEAAIEAGRVVIAEIPSIPGQPSTVEVALQLASPQVGPLEGIMFFSIIDSISAVFPSRALLILTINASSQASLRIISLQKELEGTQGQVVGFNASGEAEAQDMPSIPSPAKQTPITLSSTGWADNQQSVSVPGVLADETKQLIMACAASASSEDWDAAEIQLASQAADSVTFSCTTTPTSNLSGYVVVMEVEA